MAGERGGGLAGASGGAGVPGLRPGGSETAPARAVGGNGTGPAGGRARPLSDCAVRARPAWPQVPLDEAAPRAPTGLINQWIKWGKCGITSNTGVRISSVMREEAVVKMWI